MIEHILEVYNLSNTWDRNKGRCWYLAAWLECEALAEIYGLDIQLVIDITAVLSPRLKWARNLIATRAVLAGAWQFSGALPFNVEKAWRLLDGCKDVLSGPKVKAFAANIAGDIDQVTVDGWAVKVWSGNWRGSKSINNRQYEEIAQDYRAAAKIVDLPPAILQAITWVTIKRLVSGHAYQGQLSFNI